MQIFACHFPVRIKFTLSLFASCHPCLIIFFELKADAPMASIIVSLDGLISRVPCSDMSVHELTVNPKKAGCDAKN